MPFAIISNIIRSPLFKYVVAILIVAAILFAAYKKGANDVQVKWDLEKAQVEKEIVELKTKQGEKTIEVVTQYVDRIKIVKEKGDVITEYVDKWITKQDDFTYRLPGKFRVLHDAGVQNRVPDTSDFTNAAATEVELSTATKTITGNYSICHQNAEQLESLQKWVREMEALNKEKDKQGFLTKLGF